MSQGANIIVRTTYHSNPIDVRQAEVTNSTILVLLTFVMCLLGIA